MHSSLPLPAGLGGAGREGMLAGAGPALSARFCKQGAERAGESPERAAGSRLQLEHHRLIPLYHQSANASAASKTPPTLRACSQAILRRARSHMLPLTWFRINPICLVPSEETPAGRQASHEFVSVWQPPRLYTQVSTNGNGAAAWSRV